MSTRQNRLIALVTRIQGDPRARRKAKKRLAKILGG